MNVDIQPFALEGCKCRIKFDPRELQTRLVEELQKQVKRNSKLLNAKDGNLRISGSFTEIDEGNFALHFMLAFLGKAWITGSYKAELNGTPIVQENYRISGTFAAFTAGKGQLKGDITILAGQIMKKTVIALKG